MSRSYLFVPADSERKLQKAGDSEADALIVDLEDSVAAERRPLGRQLAQEFITDRDDCWVRINPLDTEDALADLRSVMPAAPVGICLPKPKSARDALQLSKLLDVLEQEHGIESGQTAVLPIVTERPEAMFTLHEYADTTPRVSALSWGAEDLSSAVGAMANRAEDGSWFAPYELARSLCLFAAAAAGVAAVDTVYTDFRDTDGLQRFVARARRDGFSGMLAIHPDQLAVINSALTPAADEVKRARQIVDLFAQNPQAGVLALDGEMIDRPHLMQAQRILRMSDELKSV